MYVNYLVCDNLIYKELDAYIEILQNDLNQSKWIAHWSEWHFFITQPIHIF